MDSDPHSDPSILEPQREATNTASDPNTQASSIDYLNTLLEFDGQEIVFNPRYDDTTYRLSADESIITEMSDWLRTVTHQVLRFARSKGRKDHVTLRGTTLCTYKVHTGTSNPPFGIITPSSDDDSPYRWYVPLDRIDRTVFTLSMCSDCKSKLKQLGINQKHFSRYQGNISAPTCPNCGREAIAFEHRDYGASVVKHETDNEPSECEMTHEDIKKLFADVFGVSVESTSRYSENNPRDYIKEFPEIITEKTGGLTGEYIQPALDHYTPRNTPAPFAGVFEFSHPNWDHICVLKYEDWRKTNMYEPSLKAEKSE